MCRFKSYVVTSDLKVHGLLRTSSHEEIMAENKIKDITDENAILTRQHVKIEVTPKNPEKMTRNLTEWIYTEDETGSLPEWYIKNKGRIEEAIFTQLTQDLKIQIVLDGEKRVVNDTELYGYDSSTMIGYGSSTMIGYDSSTMEGYGSSTMIGYDSSTMIGYGSSTMIGHGSSTMEGYGSSKMIGYDSSTMEGYGSSTMIGYGSSTMIGYDSSKMEGHDSSKMEINSKHSVALVNGKIFVHTKATVIVQEKIDASKV